MRIGDYGNYISFMDGEIIRQQTVQLVSENQTEYRFEIESDENYHLTVSKKVGFDHTWKTGENGNITRRTIIEPLK